MERYNRIHSYLREKFGGKVYKITIDGGFSCPNRDGTVSNKGCIYCNNASFNPNQRFPGGSIPEQVRSRRESIRQRTGAEKFLAYFQAFTNTYGNPEVLAKKYSAALIDDSIIGLAISTRPDCLSESVLDVLEDFNQRTYVSLEIGLQTANDQTLKAINRCHNAEVFLDAVQRVRRRNLEICVHTIIGLPGEGREEVLYTARILSGLDIQGVKIHACCVVKGTRLEEEYRLGRYEPLTKSVYVDRVCDFLEVLRPDIHVHRLTTQVPADLLIAPAWIHPKIQVINEIEKELARRDSMQGHKFETENETSKR